MQSPARVYFQAYGNERSVSVANAHVMLEWLRKGWPPPGHPLARKIEAVVAEDPKRPVQLTGDELELVRTMLAEYKGLLELCNPMTPGDDSDLGHKLPKA
jgi:hypothetical protein